MVLTLIVTGISVYFAKQEFDNGNIKAAMFWSALLGWDLHTLLYII